MNLRNAAAHVIATLGGIGYLRSMPGTVASVVSLVPLWILSELLPAAMPSRIIELILVFIVWFLVSAWAVHVTTFRLVEKDALFIVADEFLGMMVTLIPLYLHGAHFLFSLVGLVLFRIMDIRKPFGIRRIDRRNTVFAVLLDDIAAGAVAALLLWLFLALDAFFPLAV